MTMATWTGRDRDPAVVSADVARVTAAELGLAAPPPALVLPGDSDGVPAGSLLPPRERFSGMPAPTHCFVYVDARAPRPFEMRASVLSGRYVRRQFGLGPLLYAVPLSVPVADRVALGDSGFQGDPVAAERLDADRELRALAGRVAVTRAGPDTAHQWSTERLLRVEPRPEGALLIARTLHRPGVGGWSVGAQDVLGLAARIEGALL
ncbi:hypothetical protein I3F58_16065 [Streptomyces sp. MUM 203J]|nr:hypothetical protein [Streptomyces sp. MUM 203J]